MRIIVDGQKLPVNPRASKDLLIMIKGFARALHWRTLYDPEKELVYISTISSQTPLSELALEAPMIGELESVRLQGKVVCIDAGHGGSDAGAAGPSGTLEKDNTRAIALLLKEKLENNGASVVMTHSPENERTMNEDVAGLKARVALINDSDADLFVSIHNDAFASGDVSGSTTFHYGNEQSVSLANRIQTAMVGALGTKNRGARFASFYLLRYAQIPGVMVEPGFITNPEEEVLLASAAGREQIASAIYDGIVRYYKA